MQTKHWFNALPWLLLVVTAAVCVYARLRLLHLPLERDEGEYAYAGWLLLHGGVPYRDVYNMKFPGAYYLYALLLSCGERAISIRVGLIVVNLLTAALVYGWVKTLRSRTAAVFAAATFFLMSIAPRSDGLAANTEHFINLFTTACAWLLFAWLRQRKNWQLMSAGVMCGLACVTKQHAVFTLPVLLLALTIGSLQNPRRLFKDVCLLTCGVAIPIFTMLASVWVTGTWQKFVELTWVYGRMYVSYDSFSKRLPDLIFECKHIAETNLLLWLCAFGVVVFSYRLLPRAWFWILLAWFLMSFAAVLPGYYFRPHYFLLIVPFTAVYVGLCLDGLITMNVLRDAALRTVIGSVIFACALTYFLFCERDVLFRLPVSDVSTRLYQCYDFNEAVVVSDYVRSHTAPSDNVLVLGSEPEIYFYGQRRAASPYVYFYPLQERHALRTSMEREYIQQARQSNPRLIVNALTSTFNLAQHDSILTALMPPSLQFRLRAFCYATPDRGDEFVYNGDTTGIKRDRMVWEIYERMQP